MESAQPPIPGAPTQGKSPHGPPPNSPELAQQTLSSSPIPESSTTHQDTRIVSPTPTRPRPPPSQVAEAGQSSTSTLIEMHTTPDHLAQVHQSTNQGLSTPATTEERLREFSRILDRERQRERQRHRERQRREHEVRRGPERVRAGRYQQRLEKQARYGHFGHHITSPDALADSMMRTMSTNEREHNLREAQIQRARRREREMQDRQLLRRAPRDNSSAGGRAQQMMSGVEQSVHDGGADEMDIAEEGEGEKEEEEEEDGGERMATDM